MGETIAWAPEGIEPPAVIDPTGARRPASLEAGQARFDATTIAGLYQVAGPASTSGSAAARWFAVNRLAEESDLSPAAEGDLRAALAGKGLRFTIGSARDQEAAEASEGDIWRWLALAAGVFLLLELSVACWIGRR